MALIVTAAELEARRAIARGSLAALSGGLRIEIAPLLDAPVEVPREKALLSRRGGRCAVDGELLRFDPWDPRHLCPRCGREYAGGLHDRFRLYWYQMWLAERVLHAALLGVLLDDPACRETSAQLLAQYADQYLRYPNADNVLGPSRPFFSTYLESIWLLQLALALDILESGAPSPELQTLGAAVRDRLIAPSAQLIASYDEGMSNRQVWNNAALMAAARLLDDRVLFERVLTGPSGLHAHLGAALLSDGTWYEGENYHLFAHRGLWYGERLAATAGSALPQALAQRYRDGFAAPFRSLLPDLTYPSRRDSQYAVSVRQLRFAESCELGLADHDDDRLESMLARLYDPAIPRGETGRASSSADIERNERPTGLRRTDLSWRTLLHARPSLPPLAMEPMRSDLLPAQGLGILRRREGEVYVSLDYGHSGGGHGHPDRLNITLMDGAERWFDDPGTGSYVDPSLHWYRSTLAHNAPLVNGHSQPRVHGALLAYEDKGVAGWISAKAELAPGLVVRRSLVVLDDYLIDETHWESADTHEIALPLHGVVVTGAYGVQPAPVPGGTGEEDGFAFLADGSRISLGARGVFTLRGEHPSGARLDGWGFGAPGDELWSATAPAPPGCEGHLPMLLQQRRSAAGEFRFVWSWSEAVVGVERHGDTLVISRADGSVHRHAREANTWVVSGGEAQPNVRLGGHARPFSGLDHGQADREAAPARSSGGTRLHLMPTSFRLGEAHYRRSEVTWQGAGAPQATVRVTRPTPGTVLVEVDVDASQRLFVPLSTENQLDNEPASINGDSVQLYAIAGARTAGLLLVPDGGVVSTRPVDGWSNDLHVDARWRPTAAGYHLEATLHIGGGPADFRLDVIVNDVVSGRARRRGQLVLSGATGEFVYLRGDRNDPSRLLRFSLTNA
ncbi:MAG: heparinase II/III family protein [bacterium]